MKAFFDRLFSGGLSDGYFNRAFSGFGWRDVLDVLCLALLFFALYLFVRDRRAGKLFVGIAVVSAVYFLSVLLDIYALRYVFSGLFGYGLIALLIIFQPEIRAAMERIGSIPFHGLKSIGVESRDLSLSPTAVEHIVDAVQEMHFSKTGALIVIERSTRIGEYIRTGTTLNADLSSELVRAIFFDKAPLHDGAVVIRGGRVYAAGCYLPLSEKPDIFKGLGTRHRAAIGLSEQSDSIIIVVSEETGIISLAYKGELFRDFTSVSLRAKLFELLRKQDAEEEKED
ncbi:MAG: diadenylate cyclase CdaA [Clostridia bacterium]|nr:diadenylate cyclase CdaA [Clostridia bacterium]